MTTNFLQAGIEFECARSCFQRGGNKVKEHIKIKRGLKVYEYSNMQVRKSIKINDPKKKEPYLQSHEW